MAHVLWFYRGYLVYFIFYLLGIGTLLPWNFFSNANGTADNIVVSNEELGVEESPGDYLRHLQSEQSDIIAEKPIEVGPISIDGNELLTNLAVLFDELIPNAGIAKVPIVRTPVDPAQTGRVRRPTGPKCVADRAGRGRLSRRATPRGSRAARARPASGSRACAAGSRGASWPSRG